MTLTILDAQTHARPGSENDRSTKKRVDQTHVATKRNSARTRDGQTNTSNYMQIQANTSSESSFDCVQPGTVVRISILPRGLTTLQLLGILLHRQLTKVPSSDMRAKYARSVQIDDSIWLCCTRTNSVLLNLQICTKERER